MPPSIEDPKSYIKIKPVPAWQESADSKLQARNLQHYSLAEPSRDKVFKSNYSRRIKQMRSQGYNSLLWKPYQEVGSPLYLDPKILIQTSLGQQNMAQNQVAFKHEEDSDEVTDATTTAKHDKKRLKKNLSTASFVMKFQQQQDLQNIVKDLASVRETMSDVKIGHALFPLLAKAQNMRDIGFLLERQTSYETEMEENIGVSGKQLNVEQMDGRSSVLSAGSRGSIHLDARNEMTMVKVGTENVTENARPYSPLHSNICQHSSEIDDVLRIWRQLCCLHWILESCQVEANVENQYQTKVMIPLVECWNPVDPGGKTRESWTASQDRKNNNIWNRFLKGHKVFTRGRAMKKVPSFAPNIKRNWSLGSDLGSYRSDVTITRISSRRSVLVNQVAESVQDDDSTKDDLAEQPGRSRALSPDRSSVATTAAGATTIHESEVDDEEIGADANNSMHGADKVNDHMRNTLHEKDYHEHLVKLISTVKESVTSEMSQRERKAQVVADINQRLPMSVHDWSRSSYFRIGKKEVNITKIITPAATPVTDYSADIKPARKPASTVTRIRPHTAAVTRSREQNQTSRPGTAGRMAGRARFNRPMSSPAKLSSSYNFKFSSEDKTRKLDCIKEKFEGVNDSKALQLHNQLTELDKRRKQRMEAKFAGLHRTCTNSMHRDLTRMRSLALIKLARDKAKKASRSSVVSCEWYNSLQKNLPYNVHDDPGCSLVLQKLFLLAMKMQDDMLQVNNAAFLSSLRSLRPWELCSPDVAAAIEFVREHVVHMATDEFDQWREAQTGEKETPIGAESSKPK